MALSADEQMLLVAGLGYLIAVSLWAITLHSRAGMLLRNLGEIVDPDLWQALGSPNSVKAAMRDPERRWSKFVRSGEYRRQCNDVAIEMIDDYRRRTKTMLLICAGAGLLLMIRFWSLLKPDFL